MSVSAIIMCTRNCFHLKPGKKGTILAVSITDPRILLSHSTHKVHQSQYLYQNSFSCHFSTTPPMSEISSSAFYTKYSTTCSRENSHRQLNLSNSKQHNKLTLNFNKHYSHTVYYRMRIPQSSTVSHNACREHKIWNTITLLEELILFGCKDAQVKSGILQPD